MSSYYDLLNEFYDLLQCKQVSSSAQLLYYTLLQINNKCGWTTRFQRTNVNICSISGISEKTFLKARNELKQLGLIDFEAAKTRGSVTKYCILGVTEIGCKIDGINSTQYSTQLYTQSYTQSYTQTSTPNSRHNKTKDIDKDKDKEREKESKEKEYSITAVEDTSKVVSSNNLLHFVPYADIVELYNNICVSLNPVVKLTDKRKQSIGARYREYGCDIETFKTLFQKVQSSPFLKGDNQKGWQADFDWLMKPNNFVKVMEDKYKPKPQEKDQKDKEEEDIKSGKYGVYL